MQMYGKVQHTLKRERCTYAVITIFFALSYIGRFLLNTRIYDCGVEHVSFTVFEILMSCVLIFLFEGLSMGVLMMFHCINFKRGSLLASKKQEGEVACITIMPGEYHFFSDESIEAHNLADKSSNSHSLAG